MYTEQPTVEVSKLTAADVRTKITDKALMKKRREEMRQLWSRESGGLDSGDPVISASEVSPPPSEGPGPLIFDEDRSPDPEEGPDSPLIDDIQRCTPSPMDTKIMY